MTVLTHTHRVQHMPDHMEGWGEQIDTLGDTSPAPLIDKVDTTRTEQPWSLITGLITLIGVAGAAVLVVAA